MAVMKNSGMAAVNVRGGEMNVLPLIAHMHAQAQQASASDTSHILQLALSEQQAVGNRFCVSLALRLFRGTSELSSSSTWRLSNACGC